MKSLLFGSQEAWMLWRLGKITGSSVKDFIGAGRSDVKPGIWRAAAESIIGSAAIAEDDLTSSQVMERGHALEKDAIARFERETGKRVDKNLIGWERDDDPRLAVSPDGVIGKTEALEVKCLLSPKHVEALHRRAIPKNTAGYEEQAAQYFVVNEKLRKLYYIFYHPDFPAGLDFFYLTFTRRDLAKEIESILAAERIAVAKVREIVNAVSLYNPGDIEKVKVVTDELVADAITMV